MMVRWSSSVHAIGVLLLLLLTPASAEADRERSGLAPAALLALWSDLDLARTYRCEAGRACTAGGAGADQPGRCRRKDYARLIADYDNELPGTGRTPRQIFTELLGPDGFRSFLQDPLWGEEAAWGLQETLNELMAAQLAQGNERLLQGLRTRFPGTGDPSDPDQLTLLTMSVAEFNAGVDMAMTELTRDPMGLRARDTVIPTLPFWVENAAPPDQANGDVVESDLHRVTELVYRRAVANNALGKRKFFFGNVDPAGRAGAAEELKRSAQATYLHTAVLTAIQSEQDFQNNNGFELKRQVVEAQKIYEDIQAGFNPLELLGDFIPRDNVNNQIRRAFDAVRNAKETEQQASMDQRQFDVDQTLLSNEISRQRLDFLDRISALTGIATPDLPDLLSPDVRANFLAEVRSDVEACVQGADCRGQLGSMAQAIQIAEVDSRAAQEELRIIPERIRIEEERQNSVATIVLETGEAQAVSTVAITIAEAITTCACGTSSGVQTAFGRIQMAPMRGAKEYMAAVERATIIGIDSTATIENLMLQIGQAMISLERAGLVIEARRSELDGGFAELERVVRNYVSAQEDLSCAYFSNPAYRLELSLVQREADQSFEGAMVQAYYAAKALEYEWAERLENPIQCDRADCPKPIGDATRFNPITRAESVFAAASAGHTPREPSLETFLDALDQWDADLRNHYRPPADDADAPVTFSLRKDILGFGSDGSSEEEQLSILRFRDFIAEHREPGYGAVDDLVVTFPIHIANQQFFPATVENLKIDWIKVNLVSRPGFSLRRAGSNAPIVSLVMQDIATLRTFFADYPDDDDLLQLEIEETREIEDSRFRAVVFASVDGFPATDPDDTLANLSPAVSRWILKIDMDQGSNTNLLLENLGDIELTFSYRFNAPPPVNFP